MLDENPITKVTTIVKAFASSDTKFHSQNVIVFFKLANPH